MVLSLAATGHAAEVLTLDRPDAPWLEGFPCVVHAVGRSLSTYGYSPRLLPWLREKSGDYDAVVVHGIWQYHSFAAWQALRRGGPPYFVFTHGMLDPWFKRAYPLKHLKKWLYWPWADYRVLRDARAVLYTAEEERRLAHQSFWLFRSRDAVVGLGITAPTGDPAIQRDVFLRSYPGLRDKRVLLFLSRIHEKKGCDLLVEAFARLADRDPLLRLVMAGPDQTGWRDTLMRLSRTLGVEERICWPGMLSGDMKWGAYYTAELFVLPSHQENFGIVVAEALACGVPVLISNKVNIWREIGDDGVGIVTDDTLSGVVAGLEQWLALSDEQRNSMGTGAAQTFRNRYEITACTNQMVQVIAQGGGPVSRARASVTG
jgi:glycosyltransferase involved in cell wall biosynthesis